ncbi:hypothetical protein FY034_02235 [Trichlorobacter lovleyi]|uniref:hypothetical protein n=1 Tax=Trichlorobacter lovleyi TaxID=313985 RepID=UPI00224020AE|nr:hypothetical protein [Trichlorobacter lovleyi]QOX77805.1 hypothetical protein FY034_02235 [Trichlorobacter lovleyi]
MDILAITDIPRMTALFERLARLIPGLTVVSEIHRGIDELESRKPGLVFIQNHLAGLSADILHKHLKSRLGQRKARFGLISAPSAIDSDSAAAFEVILDPALSDEQLEQTVLNLLQQQDQPAKPQVSTQDRAAAPQYDSPGQEQPIAPSPPPAAPLQTVQQQLPLMPDPPVPVEADQEPAAPLTYELPRRPGISIISDFSKQLDTRSDTLQPEPAPFSRHEHELRIRDLHREPHLISDPEPTQPWYRGTAFLLVSVTLLVVVAVSLFQHRSSRTTAPAPKAVSDQKAPAPAVSTAAVPQPETKPALSSHGSGRPRSLPSFIPKEGLDPAYGKDNPGWENYRGQTNEYRVFREKGGAIKAIQIIDRSGAGIQESFYTSTLKELAGATAMRPTSSEIKEGYEIRRGDLAGLQLVQYRDAQGGRMRGFVITWP